jgi:NAD(P)-dependent dehydrogenase (short-subunit alcohol dehydrogenase family)
MPAKIALITGGSRGLGRDMALSLAKKGIDVILTYNTKKEGAENVANEIKQMGRKAAVLHFDISDFKSIDGFIEKFISSLKNNWNTDKFDFLINNAGIGATVFIPEVTEEYFDKFVNIHFKGVFFLTQKLLPSMNDNGGVVFISSGSARFNVPGYAVYASLKGAIEVLTRYVAKEFGSRGIRSNVVAPGAIETDFNNAIIRSNPERKKFLAALNPLGRVGQADDIGGVVAFLCTEDAKWINGERIEVSGGMNI